MLDLLLGPSVVSELESVVPLLLQSSLVSDTVTNSGDESSPPHNLEGVRKKKEGRKEEKRERREEGSEGGVSSLSLSRNRVGGCWYGFDGVGGCGIDGKGVYAHVESRRHSKERERRGGERRTSWLLEVKERKRTFNLWSTPNPLQDFLKKTS